MDKQAIATITQAAEDYERLRDGYITGSKWYIHYARLAQGLRDLLPKPRYYAEGRNVMKRTAAGTLLVVHRVIRYDDATAHLIAQDIAASYNLRLGEVEA